MDPCRRTLRDIADGHITIYVALDRYDTATGEPLNPPVIRAVSTDRLPAAGIPDAYGHWWEPMVQRGHLELTEMDRYGRVFYRVSDAGRTHLAEASS